MDWLSFFVRLPQDNATRISDILDARRCREGWLQGELYRHGRHLPIQTTATSLRYDLRCESPPMVAVGHRSRSDGCIDEEGSATGHNATRVGGLRWVVEPAFR